MPEFLSSSLDVAAKNATRPEEFITAKVEEKLVYVIPGGMPAA
jgi:hypothetical protein